MKTRVISALLLTALFSAILFFNTFFPLCLNITISVISFACVFELIKATGLLKRYYFSAPSLFVAVIIPFMDEMILDAVVIYSVYSLILFITLIFNHNRLTFKDLAVIYSMSIMIPSAMLTIVYTRALDVNYGMYYTILAVLAAWIPDIGAYFAGTFFGKHKLCPEISPKKTIEGFIGGSIFSTVGMLIIGVVLAYALYGFDLSINYISLLVLGFIASLTSVVGDLSFSLIKRSCGIKDFGQLIPGHGGVLDRFDSVIFTAPFAFFLIYNFPLIIA